MQTEQSYTMSLVLSSAMASTPEKSGPQRPLRPLTETPSSSRACRSVRAGGRGFEPRRRDPESRVLPLDDPPSAPQCYPSFKPSSSHGGRIAGLLQSQTGHRKTAWAASAKCAAKRLRAAGTFWTPRLNSSPMTRLLISVRICAACPIRTRHQSSRNVSSRR